MSIVDLSEAYEKNSRSCVRIINYDSAKNPVGYRSGSVIADGTKVITCHHCIEDGPIAAISKLDDPQIAIRGKLIFSDPNLDIAILDFNSVIGTPVTFSDSRNVSIGNVAFTVGYPLGISEHTLISGHVSSRVDSLIRIDAPVNHGNSGGPLFDSEGNQIGVINSKHGSLSNFLHQVERSSPHGAKIVVAGIDSMEVIRQLIREMKHNLNLGIGYAVPTAKLAHLEHVTY